MNYELAKELKETGFPQMGIITNLDIQPPKIEGSGKGRWILPENQKELVYEPNLSELIEECGLQMNRLTQNEMNDNSIIWTAINWEGSISGEGKTPEESVANLWLQLNKNEYFD